jgi:hypothetical protein
MLPDGSGLTPEANSRDARFKWIWNSGGNTRGASDWIREEDGGGGHIGRFATPRRWEWS